MTIANSNSNSNEKEEGLKSKTNTRAVAKETPRSLVSSMNVLVWILLRNSVGTLKLKTAAEGPLEGMVRTMAGQGRARDASSVATDDRRLGDGVPEELNGRAQGRNGELGWVWLGGKADCGNCGGQT